MVINLLFIQILDVMILNLFYSRFGHNPYLKFRVLLIQAVLFAFLITFYSTSQSFWSSLLRLEHQIGFVFNFIGGLGLGLLLGVLSFELDKRYPWEEQTSIRIVMQVFFGVFIVLIIAFWVTQILFSFIFQSDLRTSDYLKTDFVILFLSILLIQMSHIMMYILNLLPKQTQQIDYLKAFSFNDDQDFVFLARIAYFELGPRKSEMKYITAYTWDGKAIQLMYVHSLKAIETHTQDQFVRVERNLLVNRLALIDEPIKIGNKLYKFLFDIPTLRELNINKKDVSDISEIIRENRQHCVVT